ncbi:MAG: GAF domain-containing protein [Nanoarchaeota archaeon]|nr:GAF domain-containing protein [Nanoarchaeota archaeon]
MPKYEFSELEQDIINFAAVDLWKIASSEEKPIIKLEEIIDAIAEFFQIEECSLMMKNKAGSFQIAVSKGVSKDTKEGMFVHEGKGIVGVAIQEKKAMFVKKVGYPTLEDKNYKTENFISYPIIVKGEVKAILNLNDKIGERSFRSQDIIAIEPIADRIKFVLKELEKEKKF